MGSNKNPLSAIGLNLVAALVTFNLVDLLMGLLVWHRPYRFDLVSNLIMPVVIGTAIYVIESRKQ